MTDALGHFGVVIRMDEFQDRFAQHLVQRFRADELQARAIRKDNSVRLVNEDRIRRKLDHTSVATLALHQRLLCPIPFVLGCTNEILKFPGVFIDFALCRREPDATAR